MSDSSAPDTDRISGWKEIAQHLQRSVRSVQRWEREMGLPVHRIQTLKGQVVYARRTELDAWMARNETRASEVAEPPPYEHTPVVVAPLPRRVPWLHIVVGVACFVVIGGLALKTMRTHGPSRTVRLSDTIVEGKGVDGQSVWTHQFSQAVKRPELVALGDRPLTDSVVDLDLTGDGVLDHLVPVRFGSAPKPAESDALFVFGDDGRVLWSVQPTHVLTCGGQSFEGPWQLSSAVVSSTPGPKRVWAAFRHHTWWPSFVVELTATGEQSLRYVQAGWVMSLAEWQTAQGPTLVAGGVLNEHRRPSVVLVDVDGPPSVSPAVDPQFRCRVEDSVQPRQVSILPALEVVEALGHAYPIVYRVGVAAQDLLVEVDHSSAVVVFRPDGHAVSYQVGDEYRSRHRVLSASGKLDHSAEGCPEILHPREIREWTPGWQWRTYTVGAR